MKGEIWKDIEGFEGLYQVSNMGRVKSLERIKWNGRDYCKIPERIRKPQNNGNGYLYVMLWKDGKGKKYLVHRLVASVFCENPHGYTEVNHLDECKTNNCADNLEWCSRQYNLTYNGRAKKVGKKAGEKLRGRKQSEECIKKRSKPVYSINKVSGLITYWNSAKEASRALGINYGNISTCCKGKRNSAGGFYWMFANVNDDDMEQ